MSRDIGACFGFYLRNYGDMEVLHDVGYGAPKGVALEDWKKVRQVINSATSQATLLLREVRRSFQLAVGEARVELFDQRSTLHEHWNIRAGLRDDRVSVIWMLGGFAIDVVGASGRLYLWLQPTEQHRKKQAWIIDALNRSGAESRAADAARWPGGTVIGNDLLLEDGVTRERCREWAAEQAAALIVKNWDALRAIGRH